MGEIGEHYRDYKAAKKHRKQKHQRQKQKQKKQQTNPQQQEHHPQKDEQEQNNPHRRCWDWMLVGGTCHYAKNRTSFLTYRRAPGKIGRMRVLGVGSVELQVRRGPEDERSHTLLLENVLHLPDAICNGLCIPVYMTANPQDHQISWKPNQQVQARDSGEPLWYGEEKAGLAKLVLTGNPQGESFLKDDGLYMLSMYISGEELEDLFQRARNSGF